MVRDEPLVTTSHRPELWITHMASSGQKWDRNRSVDNLAVRSGWCRMLNAMTIHNQLRRAARLRSRIDAYARETGVDRGLLDEWARSATLGWFEVVANHGDHGVVVDLGTTLDHTVAEEPRSNLLRGLRRGGFLHARLLPVDTIWLACAPVATGSERLREKIYGHVARAAAEPG
jgi:hypothetical protein